MKTDFPGYFPLSNEGEKSAWKSGLFSFDASVLLDLYRYSDETRQELLKLFKALGPRVWITHQAAQEFLDGRLGVIGSQSKLYDDSIVLIDRIEKMFKSARGHPFLTKELLSESEAHFKKLRFYLNGKKSYLDSLILKDPIREEIAALLKERIGAAFPKKRLQELVGEGETRYKDKIPPGYEDAKKPDGNDRFGDLIIWMQLIEKAQKEKKAITFVTADEKEDWWKIFQGKTIGPRPELIAEFGDKTGVEFQMFSPDRFMKAAGEKLSQDVKEAAIEEVKEVREAGLSLGAMQILRAWEQQRSDLQGLIGATGPLSAYQQQLMTEQERLSAQRGLTGATGPFSTYQQQLMAEQERLNAQWGLTGATGPFSAYQQQLMAEQERLNAQLGPAGAVGPLSAYQQLMTDKERLEKLNAALGIKPAPAEPTASPKKKVDDKGEA